MHSLALPPSGPDRLRPARFPIAPAVLVTAALLTAILLAALPFTADAASQLLRVTPASKAEFLRLVELAPEVTTCGSMEVGDAYEFPAEEGRAAELTAAGFQVEVKIDNLESYYAQRFMERVGFGAYHTYDEAIASMDLLQAAHPTIMSPKQSIGTTLEGRSIWVYKISDNPNVDEDEPEIFFNAYIHAREPITFEIVYDLSQYLVNGYGSDPRATALVNTREIFIEPVVNPDGVQYNYQTNPNGGGMWRKNRKNNGDGSVGVDLNRNFGYQWGYDNGGSSPFGSDETYRGPSAFSELETQAVRGFTNPRHFRTAVNFHAYGDLNLFAYGYDDVHIGDYEANFALGRMRSVQNGYHPGTPWEILYNTNGDAVDWMYGDNSFRPRILAFVTEVGTGSDGFWPAESRIPALVAENREPNLHLIELADNPFRVLPPGAPSVSLPDSVPRNFIASWTIPHPDPDNAATAWNLMEGTGHTVGVDDMEAASANRWAPFRWTWSAARSHSASHSYYGGNADQANNILTSQRGHKVVAGEQLRFWTWYSIESGWDYGYAEVSTNCRDYTGLAGNITTNSDPNGHNVGNGITGTSSGWRQATFDLSAYVGETIWLRFRYNTDGGTANEGWYVDDVEPADLFTSETVVATNLTSAQYQFTNHADGNFAFFAQSVDAEGDQSIWGAPESVVVTENPAAVDESVANLPWSGLALAGDNPFSGSTELSFTIPQGARAGTPILLTVHDVSGRQVGLLRQGAVGSDSGPGRTLQNSWSPKDLPAGLYFARLVLGTQVSERRLVYLK